MEPLGADPTATETVLLRAFRSFLPDSVSERLPDLGHEALVAFATSEDLPTGIVDPLIVQAARVLADVERPLPADPHALGRLAEIVHTTAIALRHESPTFSDALIACFDERRGLPRHEVWPSLPIDAATALDAWLTPLIPGAYALKTWPERANLARRLHERNEVDDSVLQAATVAASDHSLDATRAGRDAICAARSALGAAGLGHATAALRWSRAESDPLTIRRIYDEDAYDQKLGLAIHLDRVRAGLGAVARGEIENGRPRWSSTSELGPLYFEPAALRALGPLVEHATDGIPESLTVDQLAGLVEEFDAIGIPRLADTAVKLMLERARLSLPDATTVMRYAVGRFEQLDREHRGLVIELLPLVDRATRVTILEQDAAWDPNKVPYKALPTAAVAIGGLNWARRQNFICLETVDTIGRLAHHRPALDDCVRRAADDAWALLERGAIAPAGQVAAFGALLLTRARWWTRGALREQSAMLQLAIATDAARRGDIDSIGTALAASIDAHDFDDNPAARVLRAELALTAATSRDGLRDALRELVLIRGEADQAGLIVDKLAPAILTTIRDALDQHPDTRAASISYAEALASHPELDDNERVDAILDLARRLTNYTDNVIVVDHALNRLNGLVLSPAVSLDRQAEVHLALATAMFRTTEPDPVAISGLLEQASELFVRAGDPHGQARADLLARGLAAPTPTITSQARSVARGLGD